MCFCETLAELDVAPLGRPSSDAERPGVWCLMQPEIEEAAKSSKKSKSSKYLR